ncbi:cysteine desulfurase [Bacillus sp. VT 712]|uniref:Cysteine desulfurase n=1 Tax=Priestia veravalensis TaxID=1414648 RepID=A0A0V8JNI0_9BACI|nr:MULTISPECIES: IscS subfamily cysteine desulfurase [Bacillaceae]KSU88522.1 cysteine desulfurase [Priestia veravalensis]KZB92766.1 cysteine desulfurase [Bacillus sp. VT 712]SCC11642.1 cysteine desulfurase [Priestia flexa]
MIYLDYASTTPMSKESIQAYHTAATSYYGNTNSLHMVGTQADDLLSLCRHQLASLINGEQQAIYFTSGGTESNVLAIRSLLHYTEHRGKHIITTSLEHSSVLQALSSFQEVEYTITYLPVTKDGVVSIEALQDAIQDDTVLVAIQHVNHELGSIQPVYDIGQLLKKRDIWFHCDCVQSFGKLPINVKEANIDSLSVSSHKLYGPKGVGFVYIQPSSSKASASLTHFLTESHRGTVNVPGIAAFTTAAEHAYTQLKQAYNHFEHLKSYLLIRIKELQGFVEMEAASSAHFPGIIGLTFRNVQGQYVMLQCNRHNIAVATGSACTVHKQAPLRSLLAIGKSPEQAKNFIRISFSLHTTTKDLDELMNVLHLLHKEIMKER